MLVEAFRRFQAHSGTYLAAAIAYYALLSVFPFLLGATALLSLVLDAQQVRSAVVDRATYYLPGSAELVASVLDEASRARGQAGLLSVIFLLWSATGVVGAAGWAINRALDAPPARPFLRQKLVELGMVAGAGVFLWASTLLLGSIRLLGRLVPLAMPPAVDPGLYILGAGLSAVLSFGMFAVAYRLLAAVKLGWRDLWPGAVVAALGVEVGKHLFVLYVDRFAGYSLVYGSLGAVLVFLVWAYVAAVLLTFGAELIAVRRDAGNKSGG